MSIHDLTSREKTVLRSVINQYIASGEPVASRTLSKLKDCPWSSATIRNIMADLMDAGYLEQPHPSSGRIPSDRGFRFFVEELFVRGLPHQNDTSLYRIPEEEDQVDRLLMSIPGSLATLTSHIGVILAPHFGHIRLKSIDFIPLGANRILAVLVAKSGNILNKVIVVEEPYSREELIRFSNYLVDEFSGQTLWDVRRRIIHRLSKADGDLSVVLKNALSMSEKILSVVSSKEDSFRVEGIPGNSADQELLRKIKVSSGAQDKLTSLLSRCIEETGTHVFIGSDDPFTEENACSFVANTYALGDSGLGVLGVLGTKAMEYERIIPLVADLAVILNRKFAAHDEEVK